MDFASISFALCKYSPKALLRTVFSTAISDVVVVSFRKSGRTWLRLMLSRILAQRYGTSIKLDTQFTTLFKKEPNVFFTHGGTTKTNNNINFQRLFNRKKIVLLVRDPRDVVVSLYHDYLHRQHVQLPLTLSGFIHHEEYGFPRVVHFLQRWRQEQERTPTRFLVIRYEDMHRNVETELRRFIDFIGISCTNEEIADAVQFGSFENMRTLEQSGAIKDERMQAKDQTNINSFKTRKGKVGSYREEVAEEDIAYMNNYQAESGKSFGYS